MQIKKIVSGAQTGADRAALDFAIEHAIEHGGWVPEGRLAEDGIVPSRYRVKELPGAGYPARTEKNVEDSDGTLIISRGELTGGSLLTRQMAEKHAKPCLHINLAKVIIFDAAIDVYDWIAAHKIRVLNVAGPRASKDPGIYGVTRDILETVSHIDTISGAMPGTSVHAGNREGAADGNSAQAENVEQAVDILVDELSPRAKSRIAGSTSKEPEGLEDFFVRHVIERFGLEAENMALLKSCGQVSQQSAVSARQAAMVIIERLRERLREIGQLRVIK
ncbi:MAG: putative molybdenum carrier protein [Desulfobacteraceae bacterium]|nr:putative molybdenum carrier protein [Desulfobacteraceae bacterium]